MSYLGDLRALVGHRPINLVVAAVAVLDGDGRLLLQRRSDNGLWSTPGGSLELGESLEDCARRELREETGLEPGRLRLLDVFSGTEYFVEYPNGDQGYCVGALFMAEDVHGELVPDGVESAELAYFDLDELPELVPADRRLIERCRGLLR